MRIRILSALFAVLLAPGCVMVQLGVTNPIPGLTTVAVTPFLNLSPERAVDGRRFALAYASELQKVPGFEVIPVGVTEVAMVDAKIDLNDVNDVLKLAKTLRVDAVVVGAVTEYSPYYPPRIGMQVNWYSPRSWSFYPGIQIEPAAREQLKDWDRQRLQEWRDYQKHLEDCTAPETPAWERWYHSFQRLPVIRNLYGEPLLVRDGGLSDAIWRAQSPPLGEQPTSQPLRSQRTASPAQYAPSSGGMITNPSDGGDAIQGSADAGPFAELVKIPHYQDLTGDQAAESRSGAVRLTTSDDPNARFPGGNDSQAPAPLTPGNETSLPPLPDQGHPSETVPNPPPAPPQAGPPVPIPQAPSDSSPGNGSKFGPRYPTEPFGDLPFRQELPGMLPIPLPPGSAPEGEFPGTAQELPRVPVRDPALAPPAPQPNPFNVPQPVQPWQSDPHLPLMAYTRIFDGADGDLVAALRDYVELNGDLRSGGWEGYLHRSDDFIRFTTYRMILEMLSLHGGEGKHRMIFKFRKYR